MKVGSNPRVYDRHLVERSAGQAESRTISDQAYDLILAKILYLELTPGSLLMEKALPEALGIGRTPIREALLRLDFPDVKIATLVL